MKNFPSVEALDGGLFFFPYENHIKGAIHKIKFGGDKRMPSQLSEETGMLFSDVKVRDAIAFFLNGAGISASFAEKDFTGARKIQNTIVRTVSQDSCHGDKTDLWLWSGIPTDPGRLRQRGFDLPSVLFSHWVRQLGGIWTQALCRTRKTLPMYGLSPEERKRNLQDCFAVTRDVRGKSIVLVDDIFTTGATFSVAASALKEKGAETVKGLAFCGSVENLR